MEPTIQALINRRLEYGLADLLLAVYDAGYCAALGEAPELGVSPQLADLLAMLRARHTSEVQAARGWLPTPIAADDLPGWLLRQTQQVDQVAARAEAERQRALGDAEPPAGWQP